MKDEQKTKAQLIKELVRYRTLIHQSPDPIFISRIDDFSFTDVNDRACVNYGYTRSEFLGMEIFDIETKAPLRQQVRDLYDATPVGQVIEVNGMNRRKNGTIFPVHVAFAKLNEELAMATVRDTTEPWREHSFALRAPISTRPRPSVGRVFRYIFGYFIASPARQNSMPDTTNHWPGVYLVKTAIPGLAAYPGDHIVVDDKSHDSCVLQRDLDRFDIETMLRSGAIERLGDLTPAPEASSGKRSWRRLWSGRP